MLRASPCLFICLYGKTIPGQTIIKDPGKALTLQTFQILAWVLPCYWSPNLILGTSPSKSSASEAYTQPRKVADMAVSSAWLGGWGSPATAPEHGK